MCVHTMLPFPHSGRIPPVPSQPGEEKEWHGIEQVKTDWSYGKIVDGRQKGK